MQLAGELDKEHPLGRIFWQPDGSAQLDEDEIVNALLEFYEKSKCGNNTDPGCLVRFAVKESRQWGSRWEPRVILFPQAFYVNKDYNIVCHTQTNTIRAVMEGLTAATGCAMPPDEKLLIRRNERNYSAKYSMTPSICKRVREVLACDTALYESHCHGQVR
jgi:hypothetical protein